METKMKIIEIVEQVNKMVGTGHSYSINCLITMILKNKDLIMKHVKCAILMMPTAILKKCRKEMDGETSQNEDAGGESG